MEIKYLLKGIVIGVFIAAPVGLIGLLCIKRKGGELGVWVSKNSL